MIHRNPVRALHAALDAEAYSSRTTLSQRDLQERVGTVWHRAIASLALDVGDLFFQPQGDGALIRFPAVVDEAAVVAGLTRELRNELDAVNRELKQTAQVRLRLALHVGMSQDAALGLSGEAAVTVSRLADSSELRARLAATHPLPLAVMISERLYLDLVVNRLCGLDPEAWEPVKVARPDKGFEASAWVTVPGAVSYIRGTAGADDEETEPPPDASGFGAARATGGRSADSLGIRVGSVGVVNGPVYIAEGGFTIKGEV